MPSNHLVYARLGSAIASRESRAVAKQLDRMDAEALAARRADQLAIERAVECTERGMVGVVKIALRERAAFAAAPHAAHRINAAAETGSAVINCIIASGM
jgi:hypothetical protein